MDVLESGSQISRCRYSVGHLQSEAHPNTPDWHELTPALTENGGDYPPSSQPWR